MSCARPRPRGASYVVTSRRPVILGKPPSPRGIFSLSPLRTPALWSTPATAGPAWLATPPLTGAPRRGAQPRGEGVHRVWRRVRSEGVALIVSSHDIVGTRLGSFAIGLGLSADRAHGRGGAAVMERTRCTPCVGHRAKGLRSWPGACIQGVVLAAAGHLRATVPEPLRLRPPAQPPAVSISPLTRLTESVFHLPGFCQNVSVQ